MEQTGLLSSLSLFTIVAVLIVLGGAYIWHLRSRKNREAAKRAHGLDD